jgi:hypothetical protein
MSRPEARILLDSNLYSPWRITPVKHTLAAHPLLQMPSIVELGKRLEVNGRVRTHSNKAAADTPFNDAPKSHPNAKTAAETLSDVEHANAWMSLLNIQTDDVYRQLVDEVLDSVKPIIEAKDPGMCYRAGWLFVTSPNTITPFHMDTEHGFILQVKGRKRLYVWDPADVAVVPERGRELFHSYHSRDLVKFKEEHRPRAQVFELEPGVGAYVPSTGPHMVENFDNASVTISFTFYTNSTRRKNLLYRGTNHLRRLGLDPAPVGTAPLRDTVLAAAMRGYVGGKEMVAKALKKPVYPSDAPYAFHLFS